MVNDGEYQLICMPFWGGATLAAVLAAGRQRPGGRRSPGAICWRISTASPRPSIRRFIRRGRPRDPGGLSYDQAVAWVVARLAEALDHAFSRDVAHGDVKPSNILLSADGNPMLLDFNLARDGSPAGIELVGRRPGRDARLHGTRAIAETRDSRSGRRRFAIQPIVHRQRRHSWNPRVRLRLPTCLIAGRILPIFTPWAWFC